MTIDDRAGWATLSLNSSSANDSATVRHNLSTTDGTVIGRAPDCQIPLDPHQFITVSRRHAEIKLVDAAWQLSDLGTTNGTLVNDRPVKNPQKLASGDRITLGVKGPEFTFECLTLDATVMVQPTQIKAAPQPDEAEPDPKPIESPDLAAAKATVPRDKEAEPA
ncbi:MAG: FHA domain-containing protein, partial [Cyanobacteria bacterium J06643_13]